MPGPIGAFDDIIREHLDVPANRWKNIERQMEESNSWQHEGAELGPGYDLHTGKKLPFTQKQLRIDTENRERVRRFKEKIKKHPSRRK